MCPGKAATAAERNQRWALLSCRNQGQKPPPLPLPLLFLLLLCYFSPPLASKKSSSSLAGAEQVGGEQLSILGQPPPVQRRSPPAALQISIIWKKGKAILLRGGDLCVAARRPGGAAGERNRIRLASLPFRLATRPRSVRDCSVPCPPVCRLGETVSAPRGGLCQAMQRPREHRGQEIPMSNV